MYNFNFYLEEDKYKTIYSYFIKYDIPVKLVRKPNDYDLLKKDFETTEKEAFFFGSTILKKVLLEKDYYSSKSNLLFYINLRPDNVQMIPYDCISGVKPDINEYLFTDYTLEEIFQTYSEGVQVIKNLLYIIDKG